MYKIALFSPVIADDHSLALSKFKQLFKNKQLLSPIIFCDSVSTYIEENIPIFSSIYIQQKFNKYIILTDIENIDYINESLPTIVVYNNICQEVIDKKNNIIYMSYEDDIDTVIQDNNL